jgi:hypothetical protein
MNIFVIIFTFYNSFNNWEARIGVVMVYYPIVLVSLDRNAITFLSFEVANSSLWRSYGWNSF